MPFCCPILRDLIAISGCGVLVAPGPFSIFISCRAFADAVQRTPHNSPIIMVAWLLFVPAAAAFTLPASHSRVRTQPSAAASSSEDAGMRDRYLSRLGVDAAIVDRAPNAEQSTVVSEL